MLIASLNKPKKEKKKVVYVPQPQIAPLPEVPKVKEPVKEHVKEPEKEMYSKSNNPYDLTTLMKQQIRNF